MLEAREGVSDYLAVFILIGAAVGGSALVYASALSLAAGGEPQGVSIVGGTVTASRFFASESLTVANDASSSAPSFTVSTVPLPASAQYCITLLDPASMSTISSTCPTLSGDPAVVPVSYPLPPGGSVTVELFISGAIPTLGSTLTVGVVSAQGPESTLQLQVVPA